jgi:hypothetical protein
MHTGHNSVLLIAILLVSVLAPAVGANSFETLEDTPVFGERSTAVGEATHNLSTPAGIVTTWPRALSNVETYHQILLEFAERDPESGPVVHAALTSAGMKARDLRDAIAKLTNDPNRGSQPSGQGSETYNAPAYAGQSALGTGASYSWDHILFYDTFDNLKHMKAYEWEGDPGTYSISANGKLSIVSKDSTGHGYGEVYAVTDDLGIDHTPDVVNAAAYCIETIFVPKQDLNSWFRVYNDERISLHLGADTVDGDASLYYYKAGSGLTKIKDLTVGTRYQIQACYGRDGGTTYDVAILDLGSSTASLHEDIPQATSNFVDHIVLGDPHPQDDFGWGEWEYLLVTGLSNARWFDTFNDGKAADWRSTIHSVGGSLFTGGNNLKITGTTAAHAYSYSPHFDYTTHSQASDWWKVSFDFRITTASNQWLIVATNEQFTLFMKNQELKYYCIQCGTPFDKSFVPPITLNVGQWYYFKLEQDSANTYDLYLDNPRDPKASNVQFTTNNAVGGPYIRIGDFGSNDHGQGHWDNFRVLSGIGSDNDNDNDRDDDDDGLSDAFEHAARQIIWADDFEPFSSSDTSAMRWTFTGDFGWGDPNAGTPSSAYAGTDWFIGTMIGAAAYSNGITSVATSPVVSFAFAGSVEPRLVYNVWWLFADSIDECRVRVTYTDTGGTARDVEIASFTQIGPFPPGVAPGEWWHREDSLPITVVGATNFQAHFETITNAVNNLDGGCFIDEVSIMAAGLKTDSDGDNDLVPDLEEWMWARTSPFAIDTDGDALTDREEMKNSFLANDVINSNGRADPHVVDIFFEVDRQLSAGGTPYTLSTAVQNAVASNYGQKGIRVHFWMDDSIPNSVQYDSGLFVCTGQSVVDLEATYHDPATDGLTWEIIIMEDDCGLLVFGEVVATPGNAFVLNQEVIAQSQGATIGCATSVDREWEVTIMHEHGHALGLEHFNPGPTGPWTWMVNSCTPPGGVYLEHSVPEWRTIHTAGLG